MYFIEVTYQKNVFHKSLGQYNPYVKAILFNFPALRYVLNVDDYHK